MSCSAAGGGSLRAAEAWGKGTGEDLLFVKKRYLLTSLQNSNMLKLLPDKATLPAL